MNQFIRFHTDNYALVSIINQQTSRHKPTTYLICRLVLTCLCFNIMFQAHHNYSRQEQCPSRSPFTPADCNVPITGSRGSCKTQTHSNTFPLSPLISTLKQPMETSLAPSTKVTCKRASSLYSKFAHDHSLNPDLPVSMSNLAFFHFWSGNHTNRQEFCHTYQ